MRLIYKARCLLMLCLSLFNREATLFLSTTFNGMQDHAMVQTVIRRPVTAQSLGSISGQPIWEL